MAEPAGAARVQGEAAAPLAPFPHLLTETEIYLLPDGRVVVADLPLELAALAAALGAVEPCEVAPTGPQLQPAPSAEAG